jgi:shikimate dehydrogenase
MAMSTSETGVSVFIGPQTQYVLSTSGRHSSMLRYKTLLENLGLDIAYLPISSPTPDGKIDPRCFAMALRGLNSIGGAISRDIKGSIREHLDEVDEFAANIGAVNTVVRQGDKLIGYNTDAVGFELSIKKGTQGLDIDTAVVYGYGGVTSVVIAVLKKMGMSVTITGRRRDEAERRAGLLGVELFDMNVHKPKLFINAAPIKDDELKDIPGFVEALQGCVVVFDHEMPGNKLREYCVSHEVLHLPGTDMYYPQMAAQWKLFLKGKVPESVNLEELLEAAEFEPSS